MEVCTQFQRIPHTFEQPLATHIQFPFKSKQKRYDNFFSFFSSSVASFLFMCVFGSCESRFYSVWFLRITTTSSLSLLCILPPVRSFLFGFIACCFIVLLQSHSSHLHCLMAAIIKPQVDKVSNWLVNKVEPSAVQEPDISLRSWQSKKESDCYVSHHRGTQLYVNANVTRSFPGGCVKGHLRQMYRTNCRYCSFQLIAHFGSAKNRYWC